MENNFTKQDWEYKKQSIVSELKEIEKHTLNEYWVNELHQIKRFINQYK